MSTRRSVPKAPVVKERIRPRDGCGCGPRGAPATARHGVAANPSRGRRRSGYLRERDAPPPPLISPFTGRISPRNETSPVTARRSVPTRSAVVTVPMISGCRLASMRRRVSRSTSALPECSRSTATRISPPRRGSGAIPSPERDSSTQPETPVAVAWIGCMDELPSIHTCDTSGSTTKRVIPRSSPSRASRVGPNDPARIGATSVRRVPSVPCAPERDADGRWSASARGARAFSSTTRSDLD